MTELANINISSIERLNVQTANISQTFFYLVLLFSYHLPEQRRGAVCPEETDFKEERALLSFDPDINRQNGQ